MTSMRNQILATVIAVFALFQPAFSAELGEDGLHKEPWFAVTFKDMKEDLETAHKQGKRLVIFIEQRGCIYCAKMHKEVLSDPKIANYIREHFVAVQMNMFGDVEVTDFDGKVLPEKEMVRRWNALYTPTLLFMPETAPASGTAAQAAVSTMPGAFGKSTTLHMFQWVFEKGYEGEEHFQKYHARKLNAGQ